MGKNTEISWTDHTFNSWWGCQRVSAGCEACYAETFSKRLGLKVWGPTTGRRFFGDKHWREPVTWNEAAARDGVTRRVFCASMADVFEDRRDLDAQRTRLWELIERTPALTWQLLTKRPENLPGMLPPAWLANPRPNVWLGTTVEDQQRADERVPLLRAVPAVVRFLSAEPLLGSINFQQPWQRHMVEMGRGDVADDRSTNLQLLTMPTPAWVIVGGESGTGARPCHVGWIRDIVQQCREAGVRTFIKQLGAMSVLGVPRPVYGTSGVIGHTNERLALTHPKGGDPKEWPSDLRVQEFPR